MNIGKVIINPDKISPEQRLKINVTLPSSNNDIPIYKIIAQTICNGVPCEVTFNKCIILEDGSFEALADYYGNKYTMVGIGDDKI